MTLPANASIAQCTAAFAAGTDTAVNFANGCLARIAASTLNAVVTPRASAAVLSDAAASDARYAAGTPLSPIDGVPFTLKTVHTTNGIRTTNGTSGIDMTVAVDGDVAAKLKAAGAVLLGKTNVGSNPAQGVCALFGETHNALNPAYATGGSSCGPAVAVAANLSVFDIGEDAAGSNRIPGSFNGVFALKPTRHSVSRWGSRSVETPSCPPYGTLDTYNVGPLARSLDDLDTVLSIIAGPTASWPDIVALDAPSSPTLRQVLRLDFSSSWITPSAFVTNKLLAVCSAMATAGITVNNTTQSWFNPSDFSNTFGGLQDEALLAGYSTTYPASEVPWTCSGLNYGASHVSTQEQARAGAVGFMRAINAIMGDTGSSRGATDVLILPTTPISPPAYGSAPNPSSWKDYMSRVGLFNITGHPALTIPAGIDPATGCGFGIQLVGRHGMDRDLIAYAKQVQAYI